MVGQPAKIGKYEVLNVIGRGGMGVVYKARDPQLDRLVAIKMILGATPALLKRFEVEARSTGSLQHPNIVTIYDFGDQDGSPYLVMEYLEGTSLESIISAGRSLSLTTKLNICVDICNGLQYAHERGIIHRDVKPANVMLLNDGNVKIVDFGIARIGDTGISRTEVVGSLHYMSPEQFQSQPLDCRTDIFSTGVVLYRLLTLALPFQGSAEAAVIYQIIHDAAPPLSTYVQGYPAELDTIVGKALAKNRDDRYPTCRELAFDLLLVQDQQKHQEVLEWMHRAENAVHKTEWTKAEDCLRQLLKIEKHHTQAHQLLGEVQERVRQQRRSDQVRQLRSQADEAFLERHYEDALRIVDQAVALDGTNKDLLNLREAVREAKAAAARLEMALRRAEKAQHAGDLDEAKKAVDEALQLDPHETSAKALQLVILKQVQERERQQLMRKLLDDAREYIAARDMTRAFETLKAAQTVEAGSVELQSLMKVVNAAREQKMRKAEVEKLTGLIEDALAREDYGAAIAIANEGLQRHPQDQGLLKLKTLSEAQQRRVELKALAREQFVTANELLEAGRTVEALSVLEKALQNAPGDAHLESLLHVIKDRLTLEESEEHKRQLLQRARDAVAANEFQEAVRILEDARREFPGLDEIETLLQQTLVAQKNEEVVTDALGSAQRLLTQGRLEQVVQFLEGKTRELADARLVSLLEDTRRQWEQLQWGLKSAIAEAERILQEHGPTEAAKYLEIQPAQYREAPDFRAFAEAVSKRQVLDALERELANQPDLDAQIRLVETALRKNPANEAIKDNLASVRGRKERISAMAEKARTLEASRQYAEAIEELKRVRQLYPKYPNLESEILRLERLETQRKALASKPAQRRDDSETPAVVEDEPIDAGEAGATVVMGSARLERGTEFEEPVPTERPLRADVRVTPSTPSHRDVAAPASWLSSRLVIVGVVVVAVLGAAVAYIMIGLRDVSVSIQTVPADSAVAVDGRPCGTPCDVRLAPGSHEVAARHEGYSDLTQRILVDRHGQTSFALTLPPIESSVAHAEQPSGPAASPSGKPADRIEPVHHAQGTTKESTPPVKDVVVNPSHGPEATPVTPVTPAAGTGTVTQPTGAGGAAPPTPKPSPTDTFSASPETVEQGQSAELKWDTENATDVEIEGAKVAAHGSMKVSPTESKNYHLVAKGPGGERADVVHVSVTAPAPAQPTATTGSLTVSPDDQKQIAALLDQYSDTFTRKDAHTIPDLWPGVPPPYLKTIKDSYKANNRVGFSNLHYTGEPDGTVRVVCTESVQNDHGARTIPGFTVYVTHKPGRWVIQYIPANVSQ